MEQLFLYCVIIFSFFKKKYAIYREIYVHTMDANWHVACVAEQILSISEPGLHPNHHSYKKISLLTLDRKM